MRPFRFAIAVRNAGSAGEWRDKARRIEALGYDTLIMPDHFTKQFAVIPALMAAADATTRLRVSAFVMANDYRHPVMLAKEAATIDVLSEGRLDVALGTGWYVPDYEMMGMPLDPPADRVSRLIESVRLLKRLWTEDAVDHTGRWYTTNGAKVLPKPVQQPHPPIVIGASRRQMLEFAGSVADVVSITEPLFGAASKDPSRSAPAALATQVEIVRAAAGPRYAELDMNPPSAVELTDDPEAMYEELATEHGISLADATASPFHVYGDQATIRDRLIDYRARFGFNYYRFGENQMDEYAGLVQELATV